jgi:GTP-binding protein
MNAGWTIIDASFMRSVGAQGQLPPPSLAEIAFAGRSNVGKSSLLNAVLGRHNLVRTGSTPGTTRQLNLFRARAADGLELVMVDLPGYGFAKRAKQEKARWGPLIEGYLSKRVALRAVVLILDVRRGAEAPDRDLVDFVRSAGPKVQRKEPGIIVVATKLDKLSLARQKPAIREVGRTLGCRVIGFSAATGEGTEELWRALRQAVVPKDA